MDIVNDSEKFCNIWGRMVAEQMAVQNLRTDRIPHIPCQVAAYKETAQ